MKLALRFPASAANAKDHARLAVRVAREEFDLSLDFSPASLADVDAQIESLRNDGLTGEDAAEALFVYGCYLGQVMVLHLGGQWVDTPRSMLKDVSPWPMVVELPGGSAWDAIGKAYRRLELGDSEYLPAFFAAAAEGLGGPRS